jgi:hypothetical protein
MMTRLEAFPINNYDRVCNAKTRNRDWRLDPPFKFTKIRKICFVVEFEVKETLAETEFRRGSGKVRYGPKSRWAQNQPNKKLAAFWAFELNEISQIWLISLKPARL